MKTPWGETGYITYKRTYSRRMDNGNMEEFTDTIERVLSASNNQLGCNFSTTEQDELRDILLGLKGMVAGRFLWQLGTKTVDNLGLASLQNCATVRIDHPVNPFTWAMDMLMLGSGVGFNLQREHVAKLPIVKQITITRVDDSSADFIVPDTREGWVSLLTRVLSAHFYSGKSFSFSTHCIRSKGSPIKGFGGVASGPEELVQGMQWISEVLNKRAGSKPTPVDCLDIMNIIGFIVVSGNVRRSAQLAIGDYDDLEYLRAKRWDLGNIPNWRAMSNNSVFCKDTRKLPEEFWEGYTGNGEPYGLINLDLSKTVGRSFETKYPDPNITGYNPCVAGETLVLTDKGHTPIKDLVGKNTNVWNGQEWSEVEAKVTGRDQHMVLVRTSDGRSLKCTLYHKFHLENGEVLEASDLSPGDTLEEWSAPIITDGVSSNLNNMYPEGFECSYKMCLRRNDLEENETLAVPLSAKLSDKMAWLSGLIDGTVQRKYKGGIHLSSFHGDFITELGYMLQTCGIRATMASQFGASTLYLSNHDMQALIDLGLKSHRLEFDQPEGTRQPRSIEVVEVVQLDEIEKEVFCFDEPKQHRGIFNGILTGQCAEQSLESNETCCLAEIFLPNINSQDEFNKVAAYLYRICKHSLRLPCHQAATEEVVHRNMRMGIGVTGVAQASMEQMMFLDEGYEELRRLDREYSKEKGWPTSIKLTCVKPSGTLSLLAGVTPGAHPGYSQYFIRRIRIASNSPLVTMCSEYGYPSEPVRNFDGTKDQNTVVVSFPCKYPTGTTLTKDTTAIRQLETVSFLQSNWADNSVSCTIYYKKEELEGIKKYLEANYRNTIKTCSFLLHSDHGFDQAPFEEITESEYLAMKLHVKDITGIDVSEDDFEVESCDTGACPVK